MSKDPLDGDWDLSRLYQELGLPTANMPLDPSQPDAGWSKLQPNAGRGQLQYGQARRASGRRSLARTISNLLIVMGVVLLVAAGGVWGFTQWRYHESEVENERLAAYAEVFENPSDAPQVDWEGLREINDDVIGWLYVPGTTINYAVYQGEDNTQYLHHSATGNWVVSGQLFMDYQSSAPGMVDEQSIIYGHYLLNGTMFEQIAAMDDQDKFNEIGTVWYVTDQGAHELVPLLMYYSRADNQDVRRFNFDNVDEYHAYLGSLLDKSVTSRPDAARIIQGTRHVLSLVTCNYYREYYDEDGTNGRSILVCVPKAEVDAVLAPQT